MKSIETTTAKKDIYERVTEVIVQAIEEGAGTYKMPWRTSGGFPNSPVNAVSKRPYRGVNILVLWATAQTKGYKCGTWATYRQWQELGAQVRKGEKSANVVFWKFFDRDGETPDTDGENEKSARRIPMARDYFVFNSEQVDGYVALDEQRTPRTERIESAEAFFQSLGIDVKPGGNRACYVPDTDSIHMPPFEAFKEALYFYSVLSHEATHWSGARHRLDRDLSGRFGSDAYAVEELVAELGSAFLCAELGLPTDPRQDHAPYIQSWLKVLKNDKRAIFTATAKAQQAVDWMTKKSSPEMEEAA
jgi:antirestriction protein ArdC